ATLGGVLAAGQSGLDRLRYGPSRHHVLGMRVVLADGTSAKSGGKLVKNVTGFDLHRLYCGSHGTLGGIVQGTPRLFVGARHEACLRAGPYDTGAMLARSKAIARAPVRAMALVAELVDSTRPNASWSLSLHLAGLEDGVRAEIAVLQELLGACEVLEGEAA